MTLTFDSRIITGYKEIRDRLLRKPATTAELMELVEYIDEARGVLLLLLKEDIVEGLKMVLAFMDYYILSADDMELAVTAHKLLRKIQPAFEKSAIVSKIRFFEIFYDAGLTLRVDSMWVLNLNLCVSTFSMYSNCDFEICSSL